MESIVVSFVNISFELGESLLKQNLITKDDIDETGMIVLVGIPCLSVLHCVENSVARNDDKIHFANGSSLSRLQIDLFPSDIRTLLLGLLDAIQVFKQLGLNVEQYRLFKRCVLRGEDLESIQTNSECLRRSKNLYTKVKGIALKITQLSAYKANFNNVLNLLKELEV